jgi:SNF2 family DNA or RNA helicase
MKKLWKHQQYAVEKYKDRPYFGLLFDMGLGKTLTVTRIAEEKDKPVLIIAPNALCSQWEKELTDKGEDRITEKDWEVVLCTSRTKHTKKFKEALDTLCK